MWQEHNETKPAMCSYRSLFPASEKLWDSHTQLFLIYNLLSRSEKEGERKKNHSVA